MMEKRLPIAMVVRLGHAQDGPADRDELTYTDNISVHGARVISRRFWRPGEVAVVTSLKDETKIYGRVVYCQRLADNRYTIGLSFQDFPETRSILRTCSAA